MVSEEVIEKISHLPMKPGVYLWRDAYKRIIYVGKAINLRNRVRSYVRGIERQAVKVRAMMERAADVEVIQTKTEMEALILENTLIKEHRPKYNILLRDDKTYPYVKVTVQEDYPRLFMTRRLDRDGAKYYGPFTDVGAVHGTITLFHNVFPLRNCKSMNVDRPCLQYHMKRCEAPCVYPVDKEKYRGYIQQVMDLFEGKKIDLMRDLEQAMNDAAEDLRFEEAARYRDQLEALEKMREKQHVVLEKGDLDVVGLASDYGMTCIQIFFVRQGRLIGREHFFAQTEEEESSLIMTEFLKQYYSGATLLPKEVLLPLDTAEKELLSQWLTERKGQHVTMHVPQRGHKKDLVQMAMENAKTFLSESRRQWQNQFDKSSGALEGLAKTLDLPRLPERMECFDISHFQGAETVASMVVFEGGRPAKKEYRRFKLKTVQGKPDDFKSMAEIMERRYGKERDWPLPDLIIIDGGKGQLSSALPIIRQMGIEDVPVISLAKRIEEVFTEHSKESIILSHHSQELQLLQQIRDEAHRFAITYHRKLRGKKTLTSILDAIEGVGPKRRKALWNHFKTLEAMRGATVEELSAVEGMNEKVAQRVYDFFKLSKEEKQQLLDLK